MATSSFDSVITINKRTADSLVKIIENDDYNTVVLETNHVVQKATPSKLRIIFGKDKVDQDERS